MNIEIVVRSILGLLALWIVVYRLWPDYRHDSFRDDIFALRGEMFLYAAQGHIAFDDPAYWRLRDRMNGLLRHGYDFTLTRMALIMVTRRGAKHESFARWNEAVNELPPSTQAKMREFSVRVTIFVLQHVVFYSFFRYLIVRPLMFAVEIREVIASPKVASGVERLESKTLEQDVYLDRHPMTA